MLMRPLGDTGLLVSGLSFGAMTFGGSGMFSIVGDTDDAGADRLVGLCLDAGINLFDTADIYSEGASEEILGRALKARSSDALIATKAFNRMGPGSNDLGASRYHLVRACEASLRRLGVDHIDLYQVHQYDVQTAHEETLRALDDLVRQGKVRYVGCSNYPASQLMKALAISERRGLERFVSHQLAYSLAARDAEWELLPLAQEERVANLIWSPLAMGLLSGKFRRDAAAPAEARASKFAGPIDIDREKVFDTVEMLAEIARERGVSISQVALNYVLHQPGVTSVIIGARDEAQLTDNLGAAGWSLTPEERARLQAVSLVRIPYPQSLYTGPIAEQNPSRLQRD